MKILILLGAPGSGKGTQSALLSKHKNYNHLSTGDLLRSISKEESGLGKKIKSILESGQLVSDEFIIEVISNKLNKLASHDNVILDGFPRTLNQAIFLDNLISSNQNITNEDIKIIAIKVDNESVIKRVSGRFACKDCNAGYHELFNQPKENGICDNCGSSNFIKRKDDSAEIIKTRLKKYEQDTKPIINYYQNNNKIIEINGENRIDEIYKEIENYV
ncbi:MAG: adenylate kinase [Rickettsiales bacterium]|nr:adenylate kinase [Rickettsiales bacterium]